MPSTESIPRVTHSETPNQTVINSPTCGTQIPVRSQNPHKRPESIYASWAFRETNNILYISVIFKWIKWCGLEKKLI